MKRHVRSYKHRSEKDRFYAGRQYVSKQAQAFGIWLRPISHKVAFATATAIMLVAQVIPFLQPQIEAKQYTLDDANPLLPPESPELTSLLKFDDKSQTFQFNNKYSPTNSTGDLSDGGKRGQGSALIKATAGKSAADGVTVNDPLNNIDFKLTPKFDLLPGQQDANRVFYPLKDGSGWLVYTFQATQVAEDLVLTHSMGDRLQVDYELGLNNGMEARKLKDGSIGIFGSSLPINGNVSTGSDADAKLLAKARQNAKKDKLVFTLPRPVIRQTDTNTDAIQAQFLLQGNRLTLDVTGLSKGNYPISIDPSVYVESARGLMYGNNETNVNFDTTNNLFQKTTVSGGNIRDGVTQTSWSTTTALPAGLWASGVAVSGGFIYVVGGSTGGLTNVSNTVYWAQLNTSSSVAINTWATNTGYNLPVALRHLSLVAYNNTLYVIGGNSGSAVVDSVYKIKLAASGEPTPTWVSAGNNLPSGAGDQMSGAVAYQNQLYIAGGMSAATGTTGVNTVYTASINPDGSTSSWTALANLPAAVWGHSMATYNGYLYVVGGAVGTTMQNTIYYAQITSPGAIGSWLTNGNTFGTGRTSQGGSFMTIWAGYMYISGGCSVMNSSGYCTTVRGDVQEASINADGSISSWTTLKYYTGSAFADISQARIGAGLVSFGTANNASAANAGGTLYVVGGCSTTQNTTTGACTALTTTTRANISSEGDIGPAQNTTSLPTTAGKFASAVAINGGYLYNIGGCTNNACTSTTTAINYAAINTDGTLASWSTATAGLPAARAAAGATILGNVLYVFGGTSGSAASAVGYSAPLQSTGDIGSGTWSTNNNGIEAAALYPFVFGVVNPSTPTAGYVFTVGGCTQSGGTTGIGCNGYVATVRRCTVTIGLAATSNCTGTNGTTGTLQLPVATGIAAGAVQGNYAYLSSGANSNTSGTAGSWGGQTNLTYYIKIDNTGSMILPPGKTGTTWPTTTGKLANNGEVDVSTNNAPGQRRRAAAFAVNGYLYVLGGHDANANTVNANGETLQDMEIGKIDPTTGDIASFVDNYFQITPRWDFKGAAANGFIYAVGGCSTGSPPGNCTAQDLAVQVMQVFNNYSGSPNAYQTPANQVGTARIGASSAILNGRLYVSGGTTSVGGEPINTVEYATIQADGSLGTWTTSANNMASNRMYHELLAYNDSLYVVGGQNSSLLTGVLVSSERSIVNSSGAPGAFTNETGLTTARTGLDAVIYNGRIIASGGADGLGNRLNTVESSVIDSNGILGTFTTTGMSSFTTGRQYHASVAYNGTLYIIGGFTGSNYLSDVQYAKINADGTIGAFSTSPALPQPVSQGDAFAANGYLYVLGGRLGTGVGTGTAAQCTNNTYVASILANSAITSGGGNVPNGLGNWSQTSVKFDTPRYGHTAVYSNGRVYINGGARCSANEVVGSGSTTTDKTRYATLQSQPQVARYSYMIDALSDVFPSKSLFNGIDNGIGANWVLNYRSSVDGSTPTWGQVTNYGKTTLGTPQDYIPKNGSGTNTNYARYYWIELYIDGSQAFGYPEDVSRGPTIANMTLQFTADPSKRLRHGKTFINNVQQPLDAPF